MEYTNPILAVFCLVNSTFAYYSGMPVFHGKDLVNSKLIGYVIDRPEQVVTRSGASLYNSLGVSRGIFAPAIRYHAGTFCVTCIFVDGGAVYSFYCGSEAD